MNLVFASNNKNKLNEVVSVLKPLGINVISLNDINFLEEIPETATTLNGNAELKAEFIHRKFTYNCFADDSGLEVEALGGEPGVYSARYGGEPKSDARNISKLLDSLNGIKNRKAQFKTVIALIVENKKQLFEGVVEGQITEKQIGTNGFGYDSVFIPKGHDKTFAEMSQEEKNSISHRALAVKKMYNFLKRYRPMH